METSSENEKLCKYQLGEDLIYTGFATIEDAEKFAQKKNGKVVEVGFKDGNDNPRITNDVGLVSKRIHYLVNAGPEYQFLHSNHPDFRKYADELQKMKSEIRNDSPEEKYISNAEIEISEDPIIVLKNGQFESVTSRERSKYLKHAKVYEIGVEVSKNS